jgi:hypothetical protein
MTWVKLDDHIDEHPKTELAGPEAMWLFVCGLAYCNRTLTDGDIPKARLRKMTTAKRPEALAQRLVDAGLWHDRGEHWEVHDFADYQPSRAKVETEREAAKERQRKSRESRAGRHGVTDAVDSDAPTPDPLPSSAVLSDDNDSPPSVDRSSSSWDQNPHWPAIAEAGLILARSKVPAPRNLDAFATTCARNIAQEQAWAVPELLRLRPDLDDVNRLASVLANGGAPKAIGDAKALAELGPIELEPDFIDAGEIETVDRPSPSLEGPEA